MSESPPPLTLQQAQDFMKIAKTRRIYVLNRVCPDTGVLDCMGVFSSLTKASDHAYNTFLDDNFPDFTPYESRITREGENPPTPEQYIATDQHGTNDHTITGWECEYADEMFYIHMREMNQ